MHSDKLSAPRFTFYDDPVTILFANLSRNMHLEIDATDKTQGEFYWVCKQNPEVAVNLSNTTNLIPQSGRHILLLDFCDLNGKFSLVHGTVEVPTMSGSVTTNSILDSGAQQRKLIVH